MAHALGNHVATSTLHPTSSSKASITANYQGSIPPPNIGWHILGPLVPEGTLPEGQASCSVPGPNVTKEYQLGADFCVARSSATSLRFPRVRACDVRQASHLVRPRAVATAADCHRRSSRRVRGCDGAVYCYQANAYLKYPPRANRPCCQMRAIVCPK